MKLNKTNLKKNTLIKSIIARFNQDTQSFSTNKRGLFFWQSIGHVHIVLFDGDLLSLIIVW